MAKLIFILCLLISANSEAQQIQFRCILKFECADTYSELDNFSLRKQNSNNSSSFLQPVAELRDTGIYVLTSYLLQDDSVFIHVSSFGVYIDTLLGAGLHEVVTTSKKPGQGDYYYCGELCKGSITEHFSNGNKKIEGKFRKGYPIGKLTMYYMDGRVRSENYYNNKGRLLNRQVF